MGENVTGRGWEKQNSIIKKLFLVVRLRSRATMWKRNEYTENGHHRNTKKKEKKNTLKSNQIYLHLLVQKSLFAEYTYLDRYIEMQSGKIKFIALSWVVSVFRIKNESQFKLVSYADCNCIVVYDIFSSCIEIQVFVFLLWNI